MENDTKEKGYLTYSNILSHITDLIQCSLQLLLNKNEIGRSDCRSSIFRSTGSLILSWAGYAIVLYL